MGCVRREFDSPFPDHAPFGAWLRQKRMEVRDVPHGTSPKNMEFFYVYVFCSKVVDFIYVGFTANLVKRFKKHNNGEVLATKKYVPFELIFYEAYRNKKDAKRREQYLKTTKGKTTLKSMLKEYLKL